MLRVAEQELEVAWMLSGRRRNGSRAVNVGCLQFVCKTIERSVIRSLRLVGPTDRSMDEAITSKHCRRWVLHGFKMEWSGMRDCFLCFQSVETDGRPPTVGICSQVFAVWNLIYIFGVLGSYPLTSSCPLITQTATAVTACLLGISVSTGSRQRRRNKICTFVWLSLQTSDITEDTVFDASL